MNTKHILSSALMGAAILLGSASPIFAQSPTLQHREERVEERREHRIERHCDRVNARIDARIGHFDARRDDVVARQRRIKERITELVSRLEKKGYDVSKVRSDLEALEAMITTSDSDYAPFVRRLRDSRRFDCRDSRGAFREALEESRQALAKYRADIKANRDFIRNTLRLDLQALREQNPSSITTE